MPALLKSMFICGKLFCTNKAVFSTSSWLHKSHNIVLKPSNSTSASAALFLPKIITVFSCFINARGDIRQATSYEEDAVIRDKLVINTEMTFYTRYGDLVGRVAGFITIMLSLSSISRRLVERKTK